MRPSSHSFLAALALATLVWSPVAAVAADTRGAAPTDPALVEKIRASNAECFSCHTPQALKTPPRPGMDLAALAKYLHDPAQFDGSNHAGMECKVCHGQGYVAFPHAAEAKKSISECGECHATKALRVETQFKDSIHARNLEGRFTCQTCHDPHVYRVASKVGDPRRIVAQDNAMCVDCHNSDLRYGAFSAALPTKKARPDLDALHGWLPNTRLHWSAVRCIECHTPVSPVKSLGMSHEIQSKDKAEKNCVTCHAQDSALATRLYRYASANVGSDLGFSNAQVLGSAYVVGATRNPLIDRAVIGLVGLTVFGLLGHGAVRVVMALIRRRRAS